MNAILRAGAVLGAVIVSACAAGEAGTQPPPSGAADTLFQDGFEANNLNAWDDNYLSGNKSVATDAGNAHSGSRYLVITYPSGADGGALSKFFMPGYDRLYVRYYVRLPANWQGGTKLLMLRGSRTDNQWSSFGVAGQCPSGTNFFATNVVTRNLSTLPLRFYSYYVGMAREGDGVTCYGRHGNSEDPGGTPSPAASYTTPLDLSKGSWHSIELEVVLNSPGQSNGVHRFWLDGTLRGEWSGLRFRTSSDLRLNVLTLESSMNPGTSPQDQSLWVDDVFVATARP